MSHEPKILVSMIAYREKNLGQSVRDCYEKAANPENLVFSIVSEQSREELHPDLSFIPDAQIYYRKYDLSEYRGVLWSRSKTTEVDVEYDYILYTCGHNLFAESWDQITLSEHEKAKKKSDKVLLTVYGPEYSFSDEGSITYGYEDGTTANHYRPKISHGYVPGHGFPDTTLMPADDGLLQDFYLQFSWVFAPKQYVVEVPLDPDMNYHGEEIYVTVQSWCRGWRFYASPKLSHYHDTNKKYPGEVLPRMATHRPWSDKNKEAFWAQSDRSMIKLNMLLSGELEGAYGNISKEQVLEYCRASGLDVKWCVKNKEYDRLEKQRHAEDFRYRPPTIVNS